MSFLTQKLIWEKKQTCFIADEKFHGLGTQRESSCKNKTAHYFFFPRQLWVKEPRHKENIFAKKRNASIS